MSIIADACKRYGQKVLLNASGSAQVPAQREKQEEGLQSSVLQGLLQWVNKTSVQLQPPGWERAVC
jgi:hypothetical protein